MFLFAPLIQYPVFFSTTSFISVSPNYATFFISTNSWFFLNLLSKLIGNVVQQAFLLLMSQALQA